MGIAGVAIKLFVEEEGSAQADRLFSQSSHTPPARFFVPDLFFIECANILWKYVHRFGCPVKNAGKDVVDLGTLALRTVSTADLITPALGLVLIYNITVYEVCHAALARQISLPLITADVMLVSKLAESEIDVLYLIELGWE